MKLIGKFAAALAAALVLGLGSAWVVINHGRALSGSGIQNGAWSSSLLTGSPTADPYTRAAVARAGLLALEKTETVYFTAFRDDSGAALRSNCTYIVSGGALPARWWSITAYGADHYLIPNEAGKYSENMNSITWEGEDERARFLISVSPQTDGEGDFIPSGEAADRAPFSLTLRLYNPSPEVLAFPGDTPLPTITRERCL